jgi:ankyrin repeat protein
MELIPPECAAVINAAGHHHSDTTSHLGILRVVLTVFMAIKPSLASAQARQPQEPVKESQTVEQPTRDTVTTFMTYRDKDGRAPLHLIALNSNKNSKNIDRILKSIQPLLDRGVEVDSRDNYGMTPLQCAASVGNKEMVSFFIAHGADVNAKDNAGRTALHYAAGAYVFVRADQQWSVDVVRMLLDKGANINAKDNNGLIPLRYAIQIRDKTIVKLLIDRGSDLYSVDNRGHTPYSWAREQSSFWETCAGDSPNAERLRQWAQQCKEMMSLLEDGLHNYFVAPNGDDFNPGTKEHPFGSIDVAINNARPGDTIFIREGVYYPTKTINLNKSGEYAKPICLYAYFGEHPVIDFSRTNSFSFLVTGSYWHLRDLTITGGYRGIFIIGSGAHHNVLEKITSFAHNYSGFSLRDGIAHNIILNCDAYENFDPHWNGEYPDGFEVRFGDGEGNILIGNRAWNNSDDGFDFSDAAHAVRLEWCFAFDNGKNIWHYPAFCGDGNGFKLNTSMSTLPHLLVRCISWDNGYRGFSDLENNNGAYFYNCIALRNSSDDFTFSDTWKGILSNNIGFKITGGKSSISAKAINGQPNSWNADPGIHLSDVDFLSLDDSNMSAPRNPDGSIPQNNFLRLAPTSKAIDAGTDIGMPFVGRRPDLGAFEYDPNAVSGGYIKMLHQYVRDRNIEKIKELLDRGEDINDKDWLGYTPLQWAIYFGYPEVVELLLSRGADPDIQSDTGRYALEIAKAMVYADIEKLLLQSGANADMPTAGEQKIPAQVQATESQELTQVVTQQAFLTAVRSDRVDEAANLLTQGAEVNAVDKFGMPLLVLAVSQENVDMVKLLVEHGARLDVRAPNGMSVIQFAVSRGMQEIVKVLLSHGVDTSSLHMAACTGDLTSVQRLIDRGADVNAKDEIGWTPLFWAASMGRKEVVTLLIAKGADATVTAKTADGQNTALYQAVQAGNRDIAQLLIAHGADVNAVDVNGDPLLWSAVGHNDLDLVKLLVEYGARLDVRAPNGMSVIQFAAFQGMGEIVKAFLSHGVDTSSLHMAAAAGDLTAVKTLLAQGVDVNAKDEVGFTPLLWAAVTDQADVAEYLIAKDADMDVETRLGRTNLLYVATKSDSTRVMKLALSDAATNVNAAAFNIRNTPLFEARSREAVELLIDNNAEVNARNRLRQTPLHMACVRGDKDLVALLLAKGADIKAKDRRGQTPLDLARQQGHDEIVKLLSEYAPEASSETEPNLVLPQPADIQ